ARLLGLGFDDMRVAQVEPVPGDQLKTWLAAGMQADMAWLERTVEKRLQPGLVLPGARSVIMLGVTYASGVLRQAGPMWASYALYEDYHDTMKPALAAAGRVLEELYAIRADDYRYYVDTGP